MSTRMFSAEQLERLRSFPDIGRDDLIRYFALTAADVGFIDPSRGRGPSDRLGLAVQLATLPWVGFVPDEVSAAPPVAVARLAEQLRLDPALLERYGQRAQTRSDHLRLVAGYLGWKSAPASDVEMKELEQFLLDRAMEHDSPALLFNLACEYLISARTIRPGVLSAHLTGAQRERQLPRRDHRRCRRGAGPSSMLLAGARYARPPSTPSQWVCRSRCEAKQSDHQPIVTGKGSECDMESTGQDSERDTVREPDGRERIRDLVLFVSAVGVASAGLTFGLLADGEKEAARFINPLTLFVAITILVLNHRLDTRLNRTRSARPHSETRWILGGLSAAMVAGITLLYWFQFHERDVDVTHDSPTVDGKNEPGQSLHSVAVPRRGDRDRLAVTFRAATAPSEYCRTRMRGWLFVRTDGQQVSPVEEVTPGKEIRLHIGKSQQPVQLTVVYSPPPGNLCPPLKVSEVILYSRSLV